MGYWKTTVNRPLRIPGIDTDRAYKPAEIKRLKDESAHSNDAPPVIRKIHKKDTQPNPIIGLFLTTIKGKPAVVEYEPNADLRDTEQISLTQQGGIEQFLKQEVLPYAPDAWYNPATVKIGYEISFTKHFYKPQHTRSLTQISTNITNIEQENEGILTEIIGSYTT